MRPVQTYTCPKTPADLEGKGKTLFCDQCQHAVRDLRGLSREEIREISRANKGRLCGIVWPWQVEVSPQPIRSWGQVPRTLRTFLLALMMAFGIGFAGNSLSAQNTRTDEHGMVIQDQMLLIRGTVFEDETIMEPLPFANILIKQNGAILTGTYCGFEGEFSLSLDENILAAGPLEVVASFGGRESDPVVITHPEKGQNLELFLNWDPVSLVGIIINVEHDPREDLENIKSKPNKTNVFHLPNNHTLDRDVLNNINGY